MSESGVLQQPPDYDLVVVGGGINGAGIARDAAGRGLKVLLCEQDDLAAHTSSASSKLIHGGLRYLEQYAFRLVSKSLAEREVLLRAAPHIIWPLRFVVPHDRFLRPAWLIRLGLFLYDHLDFGKRRLLQGSSAVDLRRHPAGAGLREDLTQGFVYSDAWAEDARLVVLNALDAAERGADVLVRTRCVDAQRSQDSWRIRLCGDGDSEREVISRCLVNATGPWVSSFLGGIARQPSRHRIRQVKGSHVVVPKLFDHAYAYLLQNIDGRIVFALPYEQDFTLLGTTDENYTGDLRQPSVSAAEVDYLCTAVSRYLRVPVKPADVVWRYSGVRPLFDDESGQNAKVTRDYRLELDAAGAPLLSVFGGKLTTYRKLAEEVLQKLQPLLGFQAGAWTGTGVCLPGGDIDGADFDAFLAAAAGKWPWLPRELLHRYARAYGTRIAKLVGASRALADLGADLGDGVYATELIYLRDVEWARTADDVLWRRSKLGLHVSDATKKRISRWYENATATDQRNLAGHN